MSSRGPPVFASPALGLCSSFQLLDTPVKSDIEEERIYLVSSSRLHLIMEGSHGRNSRQKLEVWHSCSSTRHSLRPWNSLSSQEVVCFYEFNWFDWWSLWEVMAAGTLAMMLVSRLAGWLILPYLFHTVQDHLPRYGATQSGLSLSKPTNNQGNTPQTANRQFWSRWSLSWGSVRSQVMLGCDKMTFKINQHRWQVHATMPGLEMELGSSFLGRRYFTSEAIFSTL